MKKGTDLSYKDQSGVENRGKTLISNPDFLIFVGCCYTILLNLTWNYLFLHNQKGWIIDHHCCLTSLWAPLCRGIHQKQERERGNTRPCSVLCSMWSFHQAWHREELTFENEPNVLWLYSSSLMTGYLEQETNWLSTKSTIIIPAKRRNPWLYTTEVQARVSNSETVIPEKWSCWGDPLKALNVLVWGSLSIPRQKQFHSPSMVYR